MKRPLIATGLLLSAAFLLMRPAPAAAERIVLDSVRVSEEVECDYVSVKFGVRVRYVSHFPHDAGRDLRIKLDVLTAGPSEREALSGRETITPPKDDVGVEKIVYEGDVSGGPFLTVHFRRNVSVKVFQGMDFRSLIIGVAEPGAAGACVYGD